MSDAFWPCFDLIQNPFIFSQASFIVISLAVLGFLSWIKPSGKDDGSNTRLSGLAANHGECSDITSPTVVTLSCG